MSITYVEDNMAGKRRTAFTEYLEQIEKPLDDGAGFSAEEGNLSSKTPALGEVSSAGGRSSQRRVREASDAEDTKVAKILFASKIRLSTKLIIVLSLLIITVISFALGRFPISPVELIQGVFNHFFRPDYVASSPEATRIDLVIFQIRLPRILLVVLVGAGLAIAGASLQGMFKNPLVSPDLLGASAGASLGACLALLLSFPTWAVQICAFAGGLVAVGMAVWLNKAVRYDPILGLVLGGILVSRLFEAGMAMIKFTADVRQKLPVITFFLMGSFSSVTNRDLMWVLAPFALGFVLLLSQRWQLNVLSFGDEEARTLGVNTRRTRLLVIIASTMLTAISVAVAGIVGWIGLVIPHLARAIVGPNYKVLLPTSMLIGASYLLVVDNLARLISTVEIPIGILTAILGVPFFVVIFRRNIRGWK